MAMTTRVTPPRDKTAANMMAIGLFFAAGGFIYFWSAFQLYMGWMTEANFSAVHFADTGPDDPWTAADLPQMVQLASGLFASGAVLFGLGVRRMLKVSARGTNGSRTSGP